MAKDSLVRQEMPWEGDNQNFFFFSYLESIGIVDSQYGRAMNLSIKQTIIGSNV